MTVLAALAVSGSARAAGNPPTVTINGGSTSTITVGNVVVSGTTGTLIANASTGAVSGTATRVASGNLPVQHVVVSCSPSPGNCKGTYTVTTTTAVTGQATAISISVADLSCPATVICTQVTPNSLTINNGNNNTGFTVSFNVGYTVTLNQLPHTATTWSFNVKGTP